MRFFKGTIFLLCSLLVACGGTSNQPNPKKENLSALLERYPDSIPLLLKRGQLLFDQRKLDQAMADAAKAYRLDSTKLDARQLLADVLNNRPSRTAADVASAQRHYQYILKKNAKNPAALVGLAATYSYQMNFEKSFYHLNQALRIDPKYRDAYIMKGSNYLFLGNRELAKSSYETAVQQDPNFFEAYLMLGSIYQAENNKICIEYYRTAVRLKPNDPDVLFSLAYAEQVFGMSNQAIALYRRMIRIDTSYVQALNQIGVIKQYDLKQLDSAMYYYNSALQSEPMFVEAWHNLGMCYEEKGDRFRALDCYKKAVKYNPNFELSRERAKALSY